jgi:hypothetical protein
MAAQLLHDVSFARTPSTALLDTDTKRAENASEKEQIRHSETQSSRNQHNLPHPGYGFIRARRLRLVVAGSEVATNRLEAGAS